MNEGQRHRTLEAIQLVDNAIRDEMIDERLTPGVEEWARAARISLAGLYDRVYDRKGA